MSWLVSIGQRAREAAGAVGNVGGAARAALSSVTSFADDRARRLGQAVRARVLHGRHVMMDDAVARLERAVAECEPAQRPAMLRRWLATIRATSEPTSETPTTTNDAPADDASGADERKRDKNDDDDDAAAADADKWASLEVAAGERADAARAGAEQDSAAAPSRGAHSPVDAFGLLPSDGAAVPIRDEGDAFEGDVVEGAVEGAAALTFRDVVLRSGALEALVLSYVDAPSSGDVETSLLVELLRDALMFDVDEDAVDDDDAAVEESVVVEGGASRSAASRLVASLAAATDAIRAQGDAEVQLGAAELRAVVAAAVGAAKKIGGAEALANRERRLRRELASIARAARDGAFGAGARTSPPRWRTSRGASTKTKGGAGGARRIARMDARKGLRPGSVWNDPRVSPRPSSPRRRVARWTSRERRTSPRTRAASDSTPSSPGPSPAPPAPAPAPVDPTQPPRRSGRSEPRRRRSRARAPTPTSSAASRARSYSTPNRFANGNPPSYEPPKTPYRRNPIDWPRASPSSETNWPGRSERRRTPRRGRGSPRRNARSLRRRTARFAAL